MSAGLSHFQWDIDRINAFYDQIIAFKSFREKPITQETFQELFNICYLLCDKIPLAVTKINSPYILRGRPNDEHQMFTAESEISYRLTNTNEIALGRFNRPGESVFYGTLPDEVGTAHFGAAASLECCKRLVSPDNKDLYQYITFGKWYVLEPFYVINFCNDNKLLQVNPGLRKATLDHEQYIKQLFPGEPARFIIEFWKFLSELAGKKQEIDQDHFLTTAFLCAIIEYRKRVYQSPTAGAIFPSTMTENEGINIVLTQAAVNKFLSLKKVHMAKFIRRIDDPKAYDIYPCAKEVQVINHNFQLIKEL